MLGSHIGRKQALGLISLSFSALGWVLSGPCAFRELRWPLYFCRAIRRDPLAVLIAGMEMQCGSQRWGMSVRYLVEPLILPLKLNRTNMSERTQS